MGCKSSKGGAGAANDKAAPRLVKKDGLSERDLDFLARQTHLSKDELQKWFREFKAINPDLELTKDDFERVFRLLKPHEPNIDCVSTFTFRIFDADNNGSITFSEFLVAYAILTQGDLRERLRYCFEMYDANNNEYLDKDEFVPVIEGMYALLGSRLQDPPPAEQLAEEIIRRGDVSRDGLISKEEFVDLLIREPAFQVLLNPFL